MQLSVRRVPRPNQSVSLDLPDDARVRDVLRSLAAAPDAVIVLREGVPLPLDAAVRPGDDLRVVNVFSGG